MTAPRFAIGIDLGTTNCTLAWVDLRAHGRRVETLPIPQLQSLRTVLESPLLPSFFYYPTAAELEQGELDPFSAQTADEPLGYVIGAFAREQMTALPGRVIHSAKSWLAHAGVDREAQMLPFASEDIPAELRLSPVEASSAYLGYLKAAWDFAFARADAGNAFAVQRVVITVPASFDEGAQQLTRMAAEMAGYPSTVRLLEEPQAAFYAWLDEQSRSAGEMPGAPLLACLPAVAEQPQTVLVCDVGGGTTDFSLFRIAPIRSAADRPAIERIAVSEHLLLGGDNIDLALAHAIERMLKPDSDERLTRSQWSHLVPQARALKERVLDGTGDAGEVFHVALPGAGASLFASALDVAVTRGEAQDIVLEGFFPFCARTERPLARKSGLREIGLPFAADSAISRHLAGFLDGRDVDAVLFAGGTLRPIALQERLLALIEAWQSRRPAHLATTDMSLAIAQGAARFASLLSDTAGSRIRGGYPHGVYLELARSTGDAPPQLVCVLPKGAEEGSTIALAEPAFDLLVNRPVRFNAYTSNRRPIEAAGTLVTLDAAAFHALPTLQTTIMLDDARFNPRTAAEQTISVRLEAQLSALGALELVLVNPETQRRWELAFNLRAPVGSDATAVPGKPESPGVNAAAIEAASAHCALFFGAKQSLDPRHKVKSLTRDLERILGQERHRWNVPLLRALWPAIHPGITRRGRSLEHENAWLYLAGYALRPGYGTDLDHWRVLQLWECFTLGLAHPKEKSAQSNWWMMWRRAAGGIPAEEQEKLFAAALPQFRRSVADFVEGTRLLGSLERVEQSRKAELAQWLLDLVRRGKATNQPHVFWALARLLGRVPLYTSAEAVVPPPVVEDCFANFESLDWSDPALQPLGPVFAAACRRTNERLLDIDDALRPRVVGKLKQARAKNELILGVHEYREVSAADRNELFGEQLPAGLRLAG
ncbi:MAG TPA: Hsp70 family protein [Burkholderiales bacterium]|nr:Hsp70 family protein [Burkholderiales bacterium]